MSVLLFLLWIILNGRVTIEIVIFGVLITAVIMLFAVKAVGYDIHNDARIAGNLPLFVVYTLNLIWEIVKASAAVMGVAFSGKKKPEPVIVEFDSGFESNFRNVILANSITLTPGTYTLFQKGGHFTVHCLRPEYAEGMADSSFVKLLRKLK